MRTKPPHQQPLLRTLLAPVVLKTARRTSYGSSEQMPPHKFGSNQATNLHAKGRDKTEFHCVITRSLCFSYPYVRHEADTWAAAATIGQLPSQQISCSEAAQPGQMKDRESEALSLPQVSQGFVLWASTVTPLTVKWHKAQCV